MAQAIRSERTFVDHTVRAKKFLAGRSFPGRPQSAGALDLARQQHAAMLAQPRVVSLSAPWQAVGPMQIGDTAYGSVTGRVTAIAIDPADATGNTVYIGTAGGGVWKSTNAAGPPENVTFTPLTDTLPVFSADSGNSTIASLSIGALSVANGVILAGTGDTNDALDSYYGNGLLRSADGGLTWTLIRQSNDGVNGSHAFTGLGFTGIAWSGANASLVVAAVSDAAEGLLVNAEDGTYSTRGLYFSADAGVTWQMATIKDGSQIVQTPQPVGGNQGGNAATAVVWNPVRQRFYAAVRYHGYYESVDGSVWTRLVAQPGIGLTAQNCPPSPNTTGSASCPIFRGAMAVEALSGDTYAFTVDVQLRDQGIWRDVCGSNGTGCANSSIAFGNRLNTTALEQGQGSTAIFQGDYDLSLAATASGAETTLFAGTVDLFRCSFNTAGGSSGCVFRNTTNTLNGCSAPAMVAPAQHAIAALPSLLFLGNDGGVWRSLDNVSEQGEPCSSDDAGHFQNLNGGIGSLAEVVSFAQHPSDAHTLLVGVGANGTAATSSAASSGVWPQISDGEGGVAAIDPSAPANWYVSTAAGVSISYCAGGTACAAADFAGQPTVGAAQVLHDASVIDAPWILDPALTANTVIGTCRVWRGPAANGSAWSAANAISANFGTSQNATCSSTDPLIRSIAAGGPVSSAAPAANAGSKVLYAGLAGTLDGGGSLGGHVFSTRAGDTATGTTAWTDIGLSPVTNDAASGGIFNPGGFDVSSVTADTHDATGLTVYATVMGFAGNGILAPHVYRSIDCGAHWTNISSNLPNAPANALAIDPNDANTVYVALDTGVYVTQQVSSCTTTNCWSIYGTSLPNAPVVGLAAAAGMPTGAATMGMLRASTYGRGIWQIPLLTAAPPVAPVMTLTPAALSFTSQAVGSTSTSQTITVTNTGSAPLTITSFAITGDFHEADDCIGSPIAVNGSCMVQVTFLPTVTGPRAGVLTIFGDVTGGQATAALSGTGAAPAAVVLNPLNLNFGTVQAGSVSSTQDLSVANTGGVSATLQNPSVTGDFRMMANTCGTILPGNVGCTVSIAFAPTKTGTRNGTLTLANSTGTQTTSLTGVGTAPATDTLSPLSLTFPSQQYGTTTAPKTVTLTNSGDVALTGIAVQITSGDFSVVSDCASSLIAHAACSFLVSFVPKSAGQLTGTLAITDEFRSQTVGLSGTATAPPLAAISPSALVFPVTSTGQISDALPVTVTNTGNGQLVISKVSVTGDFSDTEGCTTVSLKSRASCIIQVKFLPIQSGVANGILTVTGNSATGPVTVALSGTGAAPGDIVLTPVAVDFGGVTLGSASTSQNITISNTGGAAVTLKTPAISGSGDFKINANTCGPSLPPDTGCTIGVTFTPSVSGAITGTLSISDSTGTQTAALRGTGQSPATDGLSPLALSFAPQQIDTVSTAQQVTLTNSGDNPLTLITAAITSGDFTVTSGCGVSLIGHSSCAIAVASAPKSVGASTGILTVSDQFRVQTVSLSGIGVAPPGVSLSPSAGLVFAPTGVTATSPPQTLTLSNQSEATVHISTINSIGDFAIPTSANTCGSTIGPEAACTFQVVFSPTETGTRTGGVSVEDDATRSPQSAQLQGTGIDFSLDPDGPVSVTVSSGGSAVYPLLLSSSVGTPGAAALACTGVPANTTCFVTPSGPPLGATTVITVTVATGVSATSRLRLTSGDLWWAGMMVPPLLLGPLFARLRRRECSMMRLTLACIAIWGLAFAGGCGAGRVIPPPGGGNGPGGPSGPATANGTYPITVSATSAGLTRSVGLTLVVQ